MKDAWTVMAYENSKFIGRLTPDGTTTTRKIFAAMLSQEDAERIATEITSDPTLPTITARARKF